ncbi:MAG: hypothetical protein FJ255_00210 [Phycisphaerae bacterium]|nr:hypothetical protein [Phycisphaerae bacterium]
MRSILFKVFALGRFSPDDPHVRFAFAWPIPAWGWLLIALAAALVAAWSYWRLDGSRWARAVLASLRALAILLLVALLAGPELVRQEERTERDWVVVLVDRSASMQVGDGPDRDTRDEQARRILGATGPMWRDLARERNVLWLGFDHGAYDLKASATGAPVELAPPEGMRTDLAQALEQALRRVAARPVAGIVVLSDGRTAQPIARGTLKRLQADRVPVFVVPLGSPDPPFDRAVRTVEAPSAAFTGDVVPVTVTVERTGPERGSGARVELLDEGGRVLDERPLADDPSSEGARTDRVTLTARPDKPGPQTWSVRLAAPEPDLSADNDLKVFSIELVDRPIRVAYLDGYPRWEYRYLKNLLVREGTLRSAVLLLAPDRRFIQEGTDPIVALPRSAEEWAAFDVVIMGDLRPSQLSPEQLEALKQAVATRGTGLLWVGGPQSTPMRWGPTPLADLLPMTLDDTESGLSGVRPWPVPVLVRPTPAAERLALMRLGGPDSPGWPEVLADPTMGWTLLRWAQRIDPAVIKPAVETLAVASAPSAGEAPIVLAMRYGAGRVVYVGTDEIWRWRYGQGETLPERFYLPLVRLLARESIGRLGRPALLETSPRLAVVDQPVRVTVTLLDQALLRAAPRNVSVRVAPAQASRSGPSAVDLTLVPLAGAGPAVFEASFIPSEPGRYTLAAIDALLADLNLSADLDVSPPDDERRFAHADHALLAGLADQTQGRVLAEAEVALLGQADAGLVPIRHLRLLGAPEVETLWDRPIVLAALVLLLSAEWAGRRLIKLV